MFSSKRDVIINALLQFKTPKKDNFLRRRPPCRSFLRFVQLNENFFNPLLRSLTAGLYGVIIIIGDVIFEFNTYFGGVTDEIKRR